MPDEKEMTALMQLIESMDEVIKISDRKHPAWDKAKSAIAKLKQFASQPPAMTAQMKELFMTWLTGIIELDDAKAGFIIEYVENYFASQPPAPVGKMWEDSCPFCDISPVMCKSCGETLPSPVTSLQGGLLKECRDMLVMCTLLDKSGQCQELVDKVDKETGW